MSRSADRMRRRERGKDKKFTKKQIQKFWDLVEKSEGCWEWKGSKHRGKYGVLSAFDRSVRAHRFSFIIHFGYISSSVLVCHSCDNPGCVRPDHLWVGTQQDNIADRDTKGRTAAGEQNGAKTQPQTRPRGEKHGNSVFTEEVVKNVLRRNEKPSVIAAELGVSESAIKHIKKRRTWRHVQL